MDSDDLLDTIYNFLDAVEDRIFATSWVKRFFAKRHIIGGNMSELVYPAVKIPNAAYEPQHRMSFGVFNPPSHEWVECRDYTHHRIWQNCVVRKTRQLAIAFKYGEQVNFLNTTPRPANNKEAGENIARLLDYIERERLGWTERSKVHLTQYPNIVSVKLAPGWFMNSIACSLATLFLRIGFYCREGVEFDWLLDQYVYSKGTKPAIDRFLAGYYHYTGEENAQWYNKFYTLTADMMKWNLVRRENVEHFAKARWEALGKPVGKDGLCWFYGCDMVRAEVAVRHALPFP